MKTPNPNLNRVLSRVKNNIIIEHSSPPNEKRHQVKVIDPQRGFITTIFLPARIPDISNFFDLSHTEILGTLPPEELKLFDRLRKPQKTLVYLCRSGGKDIIILTPTGGGKTEDVLLHGLDCVYADDDKYILAFVHSRGLARTHKQKFTRLSKQLTEGLEFYGGYFYGDKKGKSFLREGMKPFSFLNITLLTFVGSLIKNLPIRLTPKGEEWHQGEEPSWARNLLSSKILFLDEIDSYSPSTLLLLIPLVRILKWHDSDLQVIIASATLGNPEEIAPRLLGPENDHQVLKGAGRRGHLTMNVYLETESRKLLNTKLEEAKAFIDQELDNYYRENDYTIQKLLFFLNHKIEIDYRKTTRQLNRNFETAHGSLPTKTIAKRMDAFQNNPEVVGLLTTQLAETGFDPANANRAFSYGIPSQQRRMIQRRSRVGRNPLQDAEFDIILRAYNEFENQLASPDNQEKLIAYLSHEDAVPLSIPWATLFSIKFWITLSLITEIEDVIPRIKEELLIQGNDTVKRLLARYLNQALYDMWFDGALKYYEENQPVPTLFTKKWFFTRLYNPLIKSMFAIKCRESNGIEETLGNIPYLTILRHFLIDQCLLFDDTSYVVDNIDLKKRIIYVIPGPPEKSYYNNDIGKSMVRSEIICINQTQTLALVDVKIRYFLDDSPEERWLPPWEETHSAVFIHKNKQIIQLSINDSEKNAQQSMIDVVKTKLLEELNIDGSEIKLLEFDDPVLGFGHLVLDQTNVGLAQLVYDYLEVEEVEVQSKRENIEPPKLKPILKDWRFKKFIAKQYLSTIAFIADLHLDGSLFSINGQEVDFNEFWHSLIHQLKNSVKMIVFLGDTLDWIGTTEKEYAKAKKYLFQIYEILEFHGMIDRVVFILGNHDYTPGLFTWRRKIKVLPKHDLPLNESLFTRIVHGDNKGMENIARTDKFTDADIRYIRERNEEPVNCILIMGHGHTDYCNPKEMTMMVPSMKQHFQYFSSSQQTNRGWMGLLGFGTKLKPNMWDIAIVK